MSRQSIQQAMSLMVMSLHGMSLLKNDIIVTRSALELNILYYVFSFIGTVPF